MRYPNIPAEIARKNMTKTSFSADFGVSRKTLNFWINTGHIPSDKLEQMADYFGVTTDYLLGRA